MPRGIPVAAKLEDFIRTKLAAKVPRHTIVPEAASKFGCQPFTAERILARLDPLPPGRPKKARASVAPVPPKPDPKPKATEPDPPAHADSPRSRFVRRVAAIAESAFDKVMGAVTSRLEDSFAAAASGSTDRIISALEEIEVDVRVKPMAVAPDPPVVRTAVAPSSSPRAKSTDATGEDPEPREHDSDGLPPRFESRAPQLSRLGSGEHVRSGRPPEMGMRRSVASAAQPTHALDPRAPSDYHKPHRFNKFHPTEQMDDFWDFEKAIRIEPAPAGALPIVANGMGRIVGGGVVSITDPNAKKLEGAFPWCRATYVF